MRTQNQERINELFDRLVPQEGKADTVAGEIVRAIARIGYRNLNDGDHIGIGYGRETCNPAARYLAEKCDSQVAGAISNAWGIDNDDIYDRRLEEVMREVLAYLDAHPELEQEKNTEDFWDYRDKDEDVDRDEEEEEEYW